MSTTIGEPIPWGQRTISTSSYTVGWLLKVLNKDIEDLAQAKISNLIDGNGFASQIIQVVLQFRDNSQQPISVILKAPIPDAFEGRFEQVNIDYFNREIYFYKYFLPYLTIPYPKIHKMVHWVPGETDGAIVMEDLSESCHILPVWQGLSLAQLLKLAENLAKLHNSFLSLPEVQRAELTSIFAPQEGCIDFQVNVIIPHALDIARQHSDVFHSKLDRFSDILTDADYHRYTSATLCEAIGLPRVPTHGDLWSNNIFWKNSAVATEIGAIFDWQGFMVGSLAFDLSRLLCLCTSAEIRRQHIGTVVSHYYRNLINPDFTEEAVLKAIDETMPYQCAHMLFVIHLTHDRCDAASQKTLLSRAAAVVSDYSQYTVLYENK